MSPPTSLAESDHQKNNLPDVLVRWSHRDDSERKRARTEQSFCVKKSDIAAQGYDLSLNRYKETVHDAVEHRLPAEILNELRQLEDDIQRELQELEVVIR